MKKLVLSLAFVCVAQLASESMQVEQEWPMSLVGLLQKHL